VKKGLSDDRIQKGFTKLTPGAGVGVIDGGVDVAEVDLAHEAVDLGEKECKEQIGRKRQKTDI